MKSLHLKHLKYVAPNLLLTISLTSFSACVPQITDVPKDSHISLNLSQSQESINAHWWEDFHNPALLYLLEHAREFNTQNKLAKTHIEMARNDLKIARAKLYPNMNLSIDPAYNQTILHPLYALTQGNVDFSYHLDFFGKYRYAKQSKHYALQASIAQSYATQLSVDMLVAKTYITLLGAYARLELLQTTLEARQKELNIMQDRNNMGYISTYDVKQAVIAYESVQTQIADTKLSIATSKNALEYLTGVDVDSEEFIALQGFSVKYQEDMAQNTTSIESQNASLASATDVFITLQAPKLPDSISSKLLHNRPDVLYAEFMLASSSAYLQKARADFLPDFNIGLNLGAIGYANFTQFLTLGGVTGSVLTPLFKGGELEGAFGIANAQRDEAAYIYRDVVIRAYREARDAYMSVSYLNLERNSTKKQQEAAREALAHARSRYDTGYSSYLEVVDAQRSLLEIETNLITLKTLYLESMFTLYGALGGGMQYQAEDFKQE